MTAASTYTVGSVKKNPDWPTPLTFAVRIPFDDNSANGLQSWMTVTPGQGTFFAHSSLVEEWPDVAELQPPAPEVPAPPTP